MEGSSKHEGSGSSSCKTFERSKVKTIDLSFEHITYTVTPSLFFSKKKEILKDVSGLFKSGELTAIMGPSGAGKSSLLNVLSGFIKHGISGEIYMNGLSVNTAKVETKSFSAYIMQVDHICTKFTVRETMMHAANLKLGHKHDQKSKTILIDGLLEDMSMNEAGNTLCGKLSGGERKRLSICLELFNTPPMLFLDEPTSGLDSASCRLLVTKLKELAVSGRTVICTIHQPSAFILSLFDHLYLLESGRTVFQGDASNLLPFLDFVGLPCPLFHNPADYIMDIVSGEFGSHSERLIEGNATKSWRRDHSQLQHRTDNSKSDILEITKSSESGPSQWLRYRYLVCHLCKQFHREWVITYFKFVLHILAAINVASMFYNFGNDGSKAQSNMVYLFVNSLYIGYTTLMPATLLFPNQMLILKREHFNNWYKFATFFLAYLSVELPLEIILIYIYIIIAYWFTGQAVGLLRCSIFATCLALEIIISNVLGIMLGSSGNPVNGVFLGSALLIALNLFGGCFIPYKDLTGVMKFISSLDYFKHAFEVKATSVYGLYREKLPCPEDIDYCHFTNSTTVLKMYGFDDHNIGEDLLILLFYALALTLLTYLRLKYSLKKVK